MSDWPTVTLKEVGVMLIDCDHKTPKAQEEGLPYVGIPQLKEGRINLDGARLIKEEDFNHWRRKAKPTPNDVILSRRCNPGETAFVPGGLEIALGQNLVLLRSDGEKIHPPFLRWVVQGSSWWNQVGKFINVGAVFDSLKCADIPKFEITVPPIASQIRIAEILGALDKKIELNRQINQTLEHIAQAIFKSWFIDFEPVKAKAQVRASVAEGKTPGSDQNLPSDFTKEDEEALVQRAAMCAISGKTDTELDAFLEASTSEQCQQLTSTVAHFPDELVDSDLGEIPIGWSVTTLKNMSTKIGSGATPRGGSKYYIDEGISLIRSQNVYDSEFKWDGLAYITDEAAEQLKAVTVELNDVLFNITGASILRTCVVEPSVLPARVNQHVAIIRAMPNVSPRYIHLHMLKNRTKKYLIGMNAGGSREAVTKGHIESVPIINPSETILGEFHELVDPLYGKIELQAAESHCLSAIRDSVLPKLLSGKISLNTKQMKAEVVA